MTSPVVDIRFEDVRLAWPSKAGQPTVALDRMRCAITAGKVTAIIGPSGCGKSTMLQLARGFLDPSAGEIRFVDRRSGQSAPRPPMATVWQGFNLFPWLTVLDNVAFGLEMGGMAKAERHERAREALAKVDLKGFESKYPRQLSGGMRQRVGIARALVMKPEVLLLDEPFGALDAQTRLVLQEQVAGIVEETGATVLLITHSIEEAILLADTIFVMTARPGRIAREIEVTMPKPRTLADLKRPEAAALFEEIYDLLRDEVIRAMTNEGGTQ
ncbi:ABC transporter ATP-binding protein [Bosea sp. BH3]|uniref:ABC transporter ATP-binding protein n=1 Tax=Bosea sp. BH3 TaxID=2871701 RepID=UPI0021CB8991|nr:ABC transporter ATP-binding protein [Bosea sp. BH3]MCU4178480.1 ABC transporter ATP-binding protein [Bosea sp. BH3]